MKTGNDISAVKLLVIAMLCVLAASCSKYETYAEQKEAEEGLDQTKDLFQQAQTLVDNVVQLMKAVTSAETQSMRDTIQV